MNGAKSIHRAQCAHTHTEYEPIAQVFATCLCLCDHLTARSHTNSFSVNTCLLYGYYFVGRWRKFFFGIYAEYAVKWPNNAQLQICRTLLSIKRRLDETGNEKTHGRIKSSSSMEWLASNTQVEHIHMRGCCYCAVCDGTVRRSQHCCWLMTRENCGKMARTSVARRCQHNANKKWSCRDLHGDGNGAGCGEEERESKKLETMYRYTKSCEHKLFA